MLDLSSAPYGDDFSESNKFYRILFRPEYAVQARELTQLQTILQHQIKHHGDNIFKQGAMVIPGQISIDTNYSYIKLQSIYAGVDINNYINSLIGTTVIGSSGVAAQVLTVTKSVKTGDILTDPPTIFVKYLTAGTDTITKTFSNNEVITTSDSVYSIQALSSSAIGVGSAATIQQGVYYVNGFFVVCDTQTILLDKYSNVPSYRVGLSIVEKLIKPEDYGYEMLLDNAQGIPNYAAPGAHRYFIDLTLTKLDISSTSDVDFIELSRVVIGTIASKVNNTAYSILDKTLARRTYDQSGDYTVRPFTIDIREHRDNNRGSWVSGASHLIGDVVLNSGITYVAKNSGTSGTTAPVHTSGYAYDGPGTTGIQWEYNTAPYYNRGIYKDGDDAKLAIGLEPGKAYIQGFEIEKIAVEYLPVDKARDSIQTLNSIVPATVGNYVLVTNVNGLPDVSTYSSVSLYDQLTGSGGRGTGVGNVIGSGRILGIEWHNGTIGTTTAIYKLFLFNIQLNSGIDFNSNVKSIYWNNPAGGAVVDFSADISPILTKLSGSVTASSTSIVGNGTTFLSDLTVGDYISLAGSLRRVTVKTDDQHITVDSTITVTNVPIYVTSTIINEPNNSKLIFPFPYTAIKSTRDSLNNNNTSYTVFNKFTQSATAGSLTLSASSGTFASSALSENYIVVDNTTGSIILPSTITPSGSSVTITGLTGTNSYSVIAALNKSGSTGTEKSKTLNLTSLVLSTASTATKGVLLLGKGDCYRIVSIMMDSGSFASPSGVYNIDISERYIFDDGQRDTYYDIGRLSLLASFSPPSAPVTITFEYFSHSAGDYFSVNSYPANVDYKNIPAYNNVSLRDVFDFRPKIDDDGLDFSDSGSSTSAMLLRGYDIKSDYSYYIPRKDKISLDFNGNFFNIKGVASLTPSAPSDPSLGMPLYNLTLLPYVFGISDVTANIIDNKRYTMRDIGKLERRIDNLEYYTSLSLLEQQTASMTIPDNTVPGLNRFKNGFIVDSFTGHTVGDITSVDYNCSIDMQNGELRPFFTMDNINLIEKYSNDLDRASANYKLYGDVITLPVLVDIPLVTQQYGSRTEFVNPFAVFTFIGDVKINPSSDDWFDVDRTPDVVQDVMGNYSTISALSLKAGILGTVWNSWQTTWTGTPVVNNIVNYWYGHDAGNSGVTKVNGKVTGTLQSSMARVQGIKQTATAVGQSRTGINTSIVSTVDTKVVDDKVLSTAIIPYIRSRNILVQAKGLKPNTKFYSYFDSIDISSYCTPASKLSYTITSGDFDSTSNVGGVSSQSARNINGDSQVCLNIGDVITGGTSSATAIVVGKEYNPDTGIHSLFIHNIIGTFVNTEIITGSLSSASGVVTSVTVNTLGSSLVSNFSGDLILLYDIPNSDAIRFRCGTKEFKLVDSSTANGTFTSRGLANYEASGVLQTKQATVVATRNATLAQEPIVDNQVIVQTVNRTVYDTGWFDPLAETFLVKQSGGAFLTKVDLYFAQKDSKLPVSIEIREVVNGYPGKAVLPFSKVTLSADNVTLSSNVVTVSSENASYPKFDTATTFKFPSPVYVQDNTEYCIVVMSDSTQYKVWISQMGDVIPDSTRTISEQPYNGVLFKSQNASTWTASQNQDLMFTIYRAQFDTSVIGTVQFVNDNIPYDNLLNNPIQTASGTNTVRVWQDNHGLVVGDTAYLSNLDSTIINGTIVSGTISCNTSGTGVTGTSTSFATTADVGSVLYSSSGVYIGIVATITNNTTIVLVSNAAVTLSVSAYKIAKSINGIPVVQLYNSNLTVSNVDFDCYTVVHSSYTRTATKSGYTGGSSVTASKNMQYDVIQPMFQLQTFSDTTSSYRMKTMSGKSVDGSETPFLIDSTFSSCAVNDNNYFANPRMVASRIYELAHGGAKSLTVEVDISSTNDALSPVIDTHRSSAILVNNKINSPSESNTNVAALDVSVLFTGTTGAYSFSGSTITSSASAICALMQSVAVGTYITIASATTTSNNGTYLVTSVVGDGSTTGTITVSNKTFASESAASGTSVSSKVLFVDEISPAGSSSISKYVTKSIKLLNPSTYIRVQYSGNIPSDSTVLVYYKTLPVGSTIDLSKTNWTLFNPDSTINKVTNWDLTFSDITYSISDLISFDTMAVKIVMQSINTSAIPRLRDFQLIACA